MSNEQNKLDELQRVKERIKALEKGHSDDLERLYISQGRDYLQEALDRYMSKDDTQYLVKGENNLDAKESYGRLDVSLIEILPSLKYSYLSQNLYKGSRKAHAYASEWDDAVDRLRVEYLKQILPLQRRRAGLEPQGEAFLQGDDQFPASHQEYYAIRNKDTQAPVARLLEAETVRQETLMNWYGWTVHQVQPLRYEYQTNVSSCLVNWVQTYIWFPVRVYG